MEAKPLSVRPMPEIKDTLAQLSEAAQYSEHSAYDKWRRNLFFALARFILENSAAGKQESPSDWQNKTMTDSYLIGRESLALFSNISYLFETPSANVTAIERAASIARRALMFHKEIQSGSLTPEVEAGYLLESEQYPYFFGTSRVPGESCDERQHAPRSRHFWHMPRTAPPEQCEPG